MDLGSGHGQWESAFLFKSMSSSHNVSLNIPNLLMSYNFPCCSNIFELHVIIGMPLPLLQLVNRMACYNSCSALHHVVVYIHGKFYLWLMWDEHETCDDDVSNLVIRYLCRWSFTLLAPAFLIVISTLSYMQLTPNDSAQNLSLKMTS